MAERHRARVAHVTPAASTFVGRSSELATLAAWLGEGRRLICVVGPPGAGKTRLARELCAREAERDAFVVDVSEARTREALADAVARGLEIALTLDESAGGPFEQATRAVASRGEALVVLDNFEQLLPDGALAVAELVAAAPRVSLVVTSRERLRVDGEQVLSLGPLPLPPEAAEIDADAVRRSDAVRLFVDRARAVRPEYAIGDEEASRVARLVHLLDGLPLPIELAASRLSLLGTAALIERLSARRLEILSHGARDAADRQSSLAAAIAWSWEMLPDDERLALARCSVFRGGFGVAAVEAVLGEGALSALQALRDKSLVEASPSEVAGGELRFRLLASIRDFAAARLDELGAGPQTRERHAAHFAGWATGIAAAAHRYGDGAARRHLLEERENLAVVADAVAVDAPREAFAALLALDVVLEAHGPASERRRRLAAALAAAPEPAVEARLRVALAGLDLAVGRPGEALEGLALAASRAEAVGDLEGLGAAARAAARAALEAGDGAAAERWVATAREAAAAAEDARGAAAAGLAAATVAAAQGRVRDAVALGQAAADALEELGAGADASVARASLSRWHRELGAPGRARREAEAALSHAEAYAEPVRVGRALLELAATAADDGLDARGAHARARAWAARIGDAAAERRSRASWALSLVDEGDATAALEQLGHEAGDRARLAALDAGLAADLRGRALLALGRHDAAREELDRAMGALAGRDLPALARAVAAARGLARRTRRSVPPAADAGQSVVAAWMARLYAPDEAAVEALEAAHAGTDAPVARSVHVRLAARWLEPEIDEGARRALRLRVVDPRGEALVCAADGAWFRPPGGELVPLEGRRKVMALLGFLVARRAEHGSPATLDDVLAAVWPGERMRPDAAANRVYATVAQLRKAGLGAVVTSGPDGYDLDSSVPLIVLE